VEVSVMRRWVPVLVLLAAAVFPASALADPPVNDTQAGATSIVPTYSYTNSVSPIGIPPSGPVGGWADATVTSEDQTLPPTCLGATGFHSMWYSVTVKEASVLTVTLSSGDVQRYQPVVSIIGPTGTSATPIELACGLGGSNAAIDPAATASAYVATGTYLVRIASVMLGNGSLADSPMLTLTSVLRDVTAPAIMVAVPQTLFGAGKIYTFDARKSTDAGSGINPNTALWTFYESGGVKNGSKPPSINRLIGRYAWRTPGLHRVQLELSDNTGNKSTYIFFVLVHNFVPPKVGLRVFVPSPGARKIRLEIRHDVPVSVRLVVLQRGRVLAVVPARHLAGSVKTTIRLPLRGRVSRNGFVVVSGVASDSSVPPNTVPFPMCAVDPVHGGGVCR